MTLTTLFFVFRKYSTYLLVTRLSESWFVEAGLANPHEQNKIPRYFVEKENEGKSFENYVWKSPGGKKTCHKSPGGNKSFACVLMFFGLYLY